MSSQIYISDFSDITLRYEIPEHLNGIADTEGQRKADLELLDTELRENGSSLEEKISSNIIWRMKFPGMILDVKRISLDSSVKLTLKPIHPYRADLAYKNDRTLPRNVSPLTVNALLESAEGSFPLGIRGGSVETGKIAIIPGGHVDYTIPEIENALETFRNEFDEELGYKFDGQVLPVCVFNNGDTNGINVLYKAKTNLSFFEIVESWGAAKDRGE
ncbi:MAG: hypothetical protein AABY10_06520, partial [Nanoarchaeota archaeon]